MEETGVPRENHWPAASHWWEQLVVINPLCGSEIWPDKSCGLWWERPYKRGPTVLHKFSTSIQQSVHDKTTPFAMKVWPYKRGGLSWGEQFTSTLTSTCIWNLAWQKQWIGLIRGELLCFTHSKTEYTKGVIYKFWNTKNVHTCKCLSLKTFSFLKAAIGTNTNNYHSK